MKKTIITIDGPAASGKEKISKYICKKYKLKHLDSGILYRQLAFYFFTSRIDPEDIDLIKKKILKINQVSFRNNKRIRTQKISKFASKIATYDCVRLFVNKLQHDFINKNKKIQGFVIDGRDIGSVVFKNANLKLYIEVNSEIRAKRRYKQLIDSGEKSIYRKILKEIKLRDRQDKNRKHSPLVIPKGSHLIENNGSFIDTKKQINYLIRSI